MHPETWAGRAGENQQESQGPGRPPAAATAAVGGRRSVAPALNGSNGRGSRALGIYNAGNRRGCKAGTKPGLRRTRPLTKLKVSGWLLDGSKKWCEPGNGRRRRCAARETLRPPCRHFTVSKPRLATPSGDFDRLVIMRCCPMSGSMPPRGVHATARAGAGLLLTAALCVAGESWGRV